MTVSSKAAIAVVVSCIIVATLCALMAGASLIGWPLSPANLQFSFALGIGSGLVQSLIVMRFAKALRRRPRMPFYIASIAVLNAGFLFLVYRFLQFCTWG